MVALQASQSRRIPRRLLGKGWRSPVCLPQDPLAHSLENEPSAGNRLLSQLGPPTPGLPGRGKRQKATRCDGHHSGNGLYGRYCAVSGVRGDDVESGVTITAMEVLAWLLIGHAIADFALQTEWM